MAKEQVQQPDTDEEEEIPLDDAPAEGDKKRKLPDQFALAKRILGNLKEQPLVERVSIINSLQAHFDTWKHELANKLLPY